MATPSKTAYKRKLDEIMKRFDRLDDQTLRNMIGLLQDYRKSVAASLLTGSDFEQFRARQVSQNVDRLTTDLIAQLSSATAQSFTQAHELGAASVVEPLVSAGIDGVFFASNPAQLNIIVDFSADLVRDIGEDLRSKINTQLRLAALGQRTPFQTMQGITNVLGIKARDGVWGIRRRPELVRGVAARSEAIVRTEMTRVFNLSIRSQQQETAKQVPGLRKRWIATADARTRPSHLAAHGQEQPVNKPFLVGGVQMDMPGDPAGPPEETVNCRCTMLTIHPELADIETPLDAEIEQERMRR